MSASPTAFPTARPQGRTRGRRRPRRPASAPTGFSPASRPTPDSGELLMVAHMNAEALAKTLETGEAWYWSRSRKRTLAQGRDERADPDGRRNAGRLRPGRALAQGPRRRRRRLLPHRPALVLLPASSRPRPTGRGSIPRRVANAATTVIPGRTAGASPEPITADALRKSGAVADILQPPRVGVRAALRGAE